MNELIKDVRSLWRMRALLGKLSLREFQTRYSGTAAGALWLYIPPLLTLACYYLVFDVVFAMRVGGAEHGAPRAVGAYLIAGMLPWIAFADAISRGMNSLLEAGGVLQKNPLPPALFITRSVLASALVYAPLLALLWLFYIPLHGAALPALGAFALLLALQLALCWLLAYLLALFAAAIRDTVQVVSFLLSLGVFLSPILFPLSMFPQQWRWALFANPMTALALGYQAVLLDGRWPPLQVWLVALAWLAALALLLGKAIGRTREELVDWL